MSQQMIQQGCDCGCGPETITVIPGPAGPAGAQGPPGADGSGATGTGGLFAVYTFAELKAIPSDPSNRHASVSGEAAPFVGQYREYMWNNTSFAAESIPDVFTPNDSTGGGRWILIGV